MTRSRVFRALIAILALMLLGVSHAHAQASRPAQFTYNYNLTTTTLTYYKLTGQNDSVFGAPIAGPARIKTTGSSVTVTAVTAGTLPFADVVVDDVITVGKPNGTTDVRVVATKTDGDNITVHLAVNWDQSSGFMFNYLKQRSGTADTDGWIETGGMSGKSVVFELNQISGVVGGIDWRIECKPSFLGALPVIMHPGAAGVCSPGTSAGGFCNFTTAGLVSGRVQIAIPQDVACGQVRFGMKINTSDAADTNEADKERITVGLEYEKKQD